MEKKTKIQELRPNWKRLEDTLQSQNKNGQDAPKSTLMPSIASYLTGGDKKAFSELSVARANNSAKLFVVPFIVSLSGHSAASKISRDYYVATLPDTMLDSLPVSFSTTSTVRGTMTLSLVIDQGNGSYSELTKPFTFNTPSTTATEIMAQSAVVTPGKPMYLRVTTYPEGNPGTGWWTSGLTINGSLVCHVSDADRTWINSDPRSF